MGVFTIEYETVIKPNLENAITNALDNEVKRAALDAIELASETEVYAAYLPKIWRRRGSLMSDDSYDCTVSGQTLTITAIPSLQGTGGGDLGDIIASGNASYHMPFPRPWMDEGIGYSLSEIESALKSGLESQGF